MVVVVVIRGVLKGKSNLTTDDMSSHFDTDHECDGDRQHQEQPLLE